MLINLVWDYPHNELLVTLGTAGGGGGGVSLLENEGDEQGNFPLNTFIFLSILFGLIFLGSKVMNE